MPDGTRIDPPPPPLGRPLIDQWPNHPDRNVALLTSVGLSDPFTWARTPDQLSVGQRARLAIALGLDSPPDVLVLDEFLTGIDAPTARACAWRIARTLRRSGVGLIAATTRDDITMDLAPDLLIRCDWTPPPTIAPRLHDQPTCSLLPQVAYRPGTSSDWAALAHLHYAAGAPATVHSYHVLTHPDLPGPAAVAIISYPDLHSAARNLATQDAYSIRGDRLTAQRLNREVLKLSRLVVAPELRGIGLAIRLVHEITQRISARWLECVTAIGPYTRWLAHAGFREIPQASGPPEARLLDLAEQLSIPPHVALRPDGLPRWAAQQSVRHRRQLQDRVWRYYHHFVLHRRTHAPIPRRVPHLTDPRWADAWAFASRRLADRPAYYILGPLDPQTGLPDPDYAPASPPVTDALAS